jgi:hypothetical protein
LGPPRSAPHSSWPFWFELASAGGFLVLVGLAWGVPYLFGITWPVQWGRLTLPVLALPYGFVVLSYAERRWPSDAEGDRTAERGVGGPT